MAGNAARGFGRSNDIHDYRKNVGRRCTLDDLAEVIALSQAAPNGRPFGIACWWKASAISIGMRWVNMTALWGRSWRVLKPVAIPLRRARQKPVPVLASSPAIRTCRSRCRIFGCWRDINARAITCTRLHAAGPSVHRHRPQSRISPGAAPTCTAPIPIWSIYPPSIPAAWRHAAKPSLCAGVPR